MKACILYQAEGKTVAEALSLSDTGGLREIGWEHTCAGHGEGSQCRPV